MRRFVQGFLVLGLATLAPLAHGQYMAPGYYPPPRPMYAPSYPYGGQPAQGMYYRPYAQPQWGQPAYYPAPATMFVQPIGYGVALPYPTQFQRLPAPVAVQAMPQAPAQAPLLAPAQSHAPVLAPAQSQAPVIVHESAPPQTGVGHLPDAEPVVSSGPAAESAGASCPPGKKQRFMGFCDGLYWTVHNVGVPYAQAFDGNDPFLSVPRGPVGVADMAYRGGIRGGVGLSLLENVWLVGTFTYFEDGTQDRIAAPDGTVIQSKVLFPNTINAAFTPLASNARYDIRLLTGDVDVKFTFLDCETMHLCWVAGARYGRVQQAFFTDYEEVLGAETVSTRIHFNGAGPRAGLEGEYKGKWGLFGYGRGMVNLLAGRFAGSFEQRNIFGGLVARTEIEENRLVPVGELEVGGGWQGFNGRVRVSGGYYVGSWFNTLTTNSLIRGIQNNDFTTNSDNFRDTLTFDGPVGRVEVRY